MPLEALPVDLIAVILGELDLRSLIIMSYLSKRFYSVASDDSLNPWRRPIMRNLRIGVYEEAFKHLSIRRTVPRHNWIDILAMARASFILFDATLPNLKAAEWQESYKRRFPPSWEKWRKDTSWKEAFLKLLHRTWHRSTTTCTTDEAWTKYIVLNRNGSANQLETSSRSFDPYAMYAELKFQSNFHHLETRYRVVLELADIRFVALGTLERPRTNFPVNANAHIFLNPPGIEGDTKHNIVSNSKSLQKPVSALADYGVYPMSATSIPAFLFEEYRHPSTTYKRLTHPQPAPSHENYPFFTPGGRDVRWIGQDEILKEGLHWVGSLMIIAQLRGPTPDPDMLERHQYSSFTWNDLWAIAPWIEDRISKRIDGAGLGN